MCIVNEWSNINKESVVHNVNLEVSNGELPYEALKIQMDN